MIHSSLLKGLPSESLISLLPGFLDVVYNKGTIKHFKKDELIHEEGQRLDYLLIPIDGDIILYKKKTESRFFNFLEKGRSFALNALLYNQKVLYSARAQESLRLIEINKDDFLSFLDEHPTYKKYLELMSSAEAVRSFKRFLSEYNVPQDKIITMISHIEVLNKPSVENVNTLIQNNIIFFSDGRTMIRFPDKEYLSKKIYEGSWIGGEALVPPHTISYEVESTSSKLVHMLSIDIVKYQIDSQSILEKFYNEPFINLLNISDDYYLDYQSEAIDQSEVNKDLFRKNFPKVSLDKLHHAKSDFETVVVGCVNACVLTEKEYNFSLIQEYFQRERKKLTPLKIAIMLEEMDLHVRSFDHDLELSCLPLLCFLGNRLLLVYGKDAECIYFHDAGYGFGKILKTSHHLHRAQFLELKSHQDEDLIDFEQNEILYEYDVSKKLSQSQTYTKRLILNKKNLLIKVALLSLAAFLIGLITPYISGKIIDEVIALKDMKSMYAYGIGLFLAYSFLTIIGYLKGLLLNEFSYIYDYDYSTIFYKKLLNLKQSFFDHINVGYVFARLSELNVVRAFFSSVTLDTFINIVTSIIYSLVLFGYGWKIALIPLSMFVIVFVLQYFFKKQIRKYHLKLFESSARTDSLVSEIISSMTTIKAFKAEKYFSTKLDRWFLKTIDLTKNLSRLQATFSALMGFITRAVPIVAVWIAVLAAFKGELSLGEIYAISLYIGRVTGPLNQLVSFFIEFEEVKISFQKIDDVLEEPSEESKKEKVSRLPIELKGLIRLDRVHFRYGEDEPYVLEDISFSIYPKQRVAIVGESGCGKTTLAQLIAGNHHPSKGKIFYDGLDQSYVSLESLRSQIGFIQQSNQLFAGSIASNITYPEDMIEHSKMVEVAQKAYCDEFINIFPTGYDQYLSEGGMGLSGGQKQRLCIARTLYLDPKLLILDEATSSLDADSEYKIIQTLRTYLQNKTSIVVAHRYSTIRNCDYILVMDQGRIVEKGTHEELMQKEGGKFFELFKSQIMN